MTTLKVGHGNVLSSNRTPRKALAVIRASGADSFGLNEAYRLVDRVQKWKGHRLTVASAPGRMQETAVLVQGRHPYVGEQAVKIADGVDTFPRIAPPRVATVAMYQHPLGLVAHTSVHLHAGVIHGRLDRVLHDYERSVRALRHMLRWQHHNGYLRVVTGDVNLTSASLDKPYSPHAMFRDLGLRWWAEGLDVVAFERDLSLVDHLIVPEARTGSDHPFLIATLKESARG